MKRYTQSFTDINDMYEAEEEFARELLSSHTQPSRPQRAYTLYDVQQEAIRTLNFITGGNARRILQEVQS